MTRSLRWLPVVFAGLTALAAFSCSSSDTDAENGGGGSAGSAGTGGGGTGGNGGSGGDQPDAAPTPHCNGELPVMQVSKDQKLVDADWSCLGQDGGAADDAGADGGADGGAEENLFHLEDFVSGNPIVGVDVELFFGNTIIGKSADFTGKTADASGGPNNAGPGEFWFPHPSGSMMAYRVVDTASKTKSLVEFDNHVPEAGKKVGGNGISPSGFKTLALAAVPIPGWEPPPNLGMIAIAARDCADNDVEGAQAEIVDDATGMPLAAGEGQNDLRYVYFNSGNFPDTTCTYTNAGVSLIVIVNAPANADGDAVGKSYTVRWKGKLHAGDAQPTVFASRKAEIFKNAVNVYHLTPR